MDYRIAFTPTPATMHETALYRDSNRATPRPIPPQTRAPRPQTRLRPPGRRPARTKHLASFGAIIFALLISTAALIGWLKRGDGWISPGAGLGYWLGIVGGSLMLLLLVYPLRRRLRLTRHIGPVTFWFRLHLIAGIIGPLLIIYHANFAFGSVSASSALLAMLMVAFSGLIGRYLYGKLYKGLHGQHTQVREIVMDASSFKRVFGADQQGMPQIAAQMQQYELQRSQPVHGLASSAWSTVLTQSQTRRAQAKLKRHAKKIITSRARQCGWSRAEKRARIKYAQNYLGSYFEALDKASSYRIYARFFSLWHKVHLPLFFVLIATVTVHIIAAHS